MHLNCHPSRFTYPASFAALAALLAPTATAVAADGFSDLRLGYTFLSESYTETRDNGVGSEDFDEDWDN